MIDYWQERAGEKDSQNSIRIDGTLYWIGDENAPGFRGFDGSHFTLKFKDGQTIKTSNLWYNGKIPVEFQDILTDNAEFVP